MEKLQRFLARSGVASRRGAAEVIEAGLVKVDGEIVTDVTATCDPAGSVIMVDGRRVRPEPKTYVMLNKPPGYVCTNQPRPEERSVMKLVAAVGHRLHTVGRLDKESEGLLLLTNDGELTNRLTHPRFKVPKTYRVDVLGRIEGEDVDKLRRGVWLDGRRTSPAKVRIVKRSRLKSLLEVTITEGLNREVRRMLARVGLKVKRLKRISIGRLILRGVGKGKFRPLTPSELRYMQGFTRRSEAETAGKENSDDHSRRGKTGRRGGGRGRSRQG